jgi:hypothetical protein
MSVLAQVLIAVPLVIVGLLLMHSADGGDLKLPTHWFGRRRSSESLQRAQVDFHAVRRQLELMQFQNAVRQDAERVRRELYAELRDLRATHERPY